MELNLIVTNTLKQLQKDIQIIAKYSVAQGRLESTDSQIKAGLAPLFREEYIRATKLVVLCALFFSLIALPAIMIDRQGFEDGFVNKYKFSARDRILRKIA